MAHLHGTGLRDRERGHMMGGARCISDSAWLAKMATVFGHEGGGDQRRRRRIATKATTIMPTIVVMMATTNKDDQHNQGHDEDMPGRTGSDHSSQRGMQELATRTATAMTIANRNGNGDVGDDSDNRNRNVDGGVGDSDDDDDEGRKMEACNHAMSFYINGSMRLRT